MHTFIRPPAAVLAALLLLAGTPASGARSPKLVVLLVVDQMRADYIDRFQTDWSAGLKRVLTSGARFQNAAYPYLTTVTCAGHATIASGAFPPTHGVFQNAWWDRDARRMITCTEDPHATNIGYGVLVKGGDSGHRLLIPSLADQMRRQRGAHVVSLSLKDRSAIMLAGHGGDIVAWLSSSLDGWATSTAFSGGADPEVKAFTAANPIDADYGRVWSPLLPESKYEGDDLGEGEAPPKGWTATFPHVLAGTRGKPDASFRDQWVRSPYADAYLGRFASALAKSSKLGKHAGTDVLAIGFSTPDLVGHAFGPRSREVQDTYAHLDRTIGALLDRLDRWVGREEYVVALTADHGVTPIPEQLKRAGQDAGRLSAAALADTVERGTQASLGPGRYVARSNGNDIYFEPGVYERLQATPGALDEIVAALARNPGIANVYRREQLHHATASGDPMLRAAALSYYPGRSGDLIVAPKPGWMFAQTGTTHATGNPDDQRVPLLLMGRGIRPGQYATHVTPADIAPTLAALCGITVPDAAGRVLREALAESPRAARAGTSGPSGR